MSLFRASVCAAILLGLAACGENEPPEIADQPSVQMTDPCAILEPSELRELFGRNVGQGIFKELDGGIRQCSWPAAYLPDLVVQLLPKDKKGVRGAATVSENFLVLDLPDMNGASAVSVLNPSPGSGLQRTVGILVVEVAGGLLRIAPLRLSIVEGSDEYKFLLKVAKSASARLP